MPQLPNILLSLMLLLACSSAEKADQQPSATISNHQHRRPKFDRRKPCIFANKKASIPTSLFWWICPFIRASIACLFMILTIIALSVLHWFRMVVARVGGERIKARPILYFQMFLRAINPLWVNTKLVSGDGATGGYMSITVCMVWNQPTAMPTDEILSYTHGNRFWMKSPIPMARQRVGAVRR